MPDAQSEVRRRVFEGLLSTDGCELTDALAAQLTAAGFDPAGKRDGFPLETFQAVLEILRRHAFPELPREEGLTRLGRAFAAGFGRTAVGFVFRTIAPALGPERTLLAIPRYLFTVRRTMKVAVHAEGPGRLHFLMEDPSPHPEFIAGCLLGILDIFSLEGTATPFNVAGTRYELLITWPVPE